MKQLRHLRITEKLFLRMEGEVNPLLMWLSDGKIIKDIPFFSYPITPYHSRSILSTPFTKSSPWPETTMQFPIRATDGEELSSKDTTALSASSHVTTGTPSQAEVSFLSQAPLVCFPKATAKFCLSSPIARAIWVKLPAVGSNVM